MPYKQEPGRGPMMKTGRGLRKDLLGPAAHEPGHNGDKKKPEMIQVKATGGGKSWKMDVAKGSRMHKMSKELGTVPEEFRNLSGVTAETDPFASGLNPEEKKKRMKYWSDKQK